MIKIGKTKITLDRDMDEPINVAINDLPMYLGEPLEIEEGVTFKRIYELLIMNRKIFNKIFHSFTRGFDIDLYLEDYLKKPKESEIESNIEYCEVYRVFEHMIFSDGEHDHEYYYGFHGVGKPTKHGITNYGFSFTSLSDLKHLPIKTNNLLDIVIDTGVDISDENVKLKDKYKSLHKAYIPISLFNFIGAILYEITFTGSPSSRDVKLNDLIETSKRIENGEEELSELCKDDDGKFYFLDEEGNKDYLDKDEEDDEEDNKT